MSNAYRTLEDGERYVIGPGGKLKLSCCDCKLVHRMKFKPRPDGSIEMTAVRDQRATAARRRKG